MDKSKIVLGSGFLVYIGLLATFGSLFGVGVNQTKSFDVTYKNKPAQIKFGIGWNNEDEVYLNDQLVENPFWGDDKPFKSLSQLEVHSKKMLNDKTISLEAKQNYERVITLSDALEENNTMLIVYISLLSVITVSGTILIYLYILHLAKKEAEEICETIADRAIPIEDDITIDDKEDEAIEAMDNMEYLE